MIAYLHYHYCKRCINSLTWQVVCYVLANSYWPIKNSNQNSSQATWKSCNKMQTKWVQCWLRHDHGFEYLLGLIWFEALKPLPLQLWILTQRIFLHCVFVLWTGIDTHMLSPIIKPYYKDGFGSKSIGEPLWRPHPRNALSVPDRLDNTVKWVGLSQLYL